MSNPESGLTENPDTQLAHNIRTALATKGITQEQLAAMAGMSFATLRRSIAADVPIRRSLNFKEFAAIAKSLGVKPHNIYPRSLDEAA